jgi:hypothetical protein
MVVGYDCLKVKKFFYKIFLDIKFQTTGGCLRRTRQNGDQYKIYIKKGAVPYTAPGIFFENKDSI